jgi:hypothetical protein
MKMKRLHWNDASIVADNALGGSEPFLYFPQNTSYPTLPESPVLILSQAAGGKKRHLIAQTAWATTEELGEVLYCHTTTLTQLGLRPNQSPSVKYRRAHWWDVLWWGDNVRLSVLAAVLTLISTGLAAFVAYQDHHKGSAAVITLIVLVVASLAAIINVMQQLVV